MNNIKESRILITGSTGMVGSALVRKLREMGCKNLLTPLRVELDLTNQAGVVNFFDKNRPEIVLHAAARVGGIYANNTYSAEFIYQNIQINTNVIHNSHIFGVKKLLNFGSSCMYPKDSNQPIEEESILTAIPEPTNEPYAIAKISGVKMCQFYRKQYGSAFLSVVPANSYGEGDNFDPQNSHVIPALIRRFHEAKLNNLNSVSVWGSGNAMREFLYIDDLANACIFVLENFDRILNANFSYINVGIGKDVSIKELVLTIKEIVGFNGNVEFDVSKPDGIMKKLLSSRKINDLGWNAKIELKDGLQKIYEYFLRKYT